jgi:hypothetical protein
MKKNDLNVEKGIQKEIDESKIEKLIERKELQQTLLDLTEEKVTDNFLDNKLDKENLKIQLQGGEIIDLAKLSVVSNKLKEYIPKFPMEFYKQIFRLNDWEIPEGKIAEKPNIVGRWTKEIIYNRFSKNVLPTLEYLNPYERIGLRMHKHHQFLNEKGTELLNKYIIEAVDLMKKCSNWYEFRIQLNKIYGVPFQLDMFRKNE